MAGHGLRKPKKRLESLEVDELSLVDKPAIEQTFIVTKSMTDNKFDIKKTAGWKSVVKKSASGDECKFCGITKEDDTMGLICSVCFFCAVDREKNGVFDDCIAGTFDFDKYLVEHGEKEQKIFELSQREFDAKEVLSLIEEQKANLSGPEYKDFEDTESEITENTAEKQQPDSTETQEENKTRQLERSKQFGIEVVDCSALTYPDGFPIKLSDYADPISFRFPINNAARVRNARSRFKQFADKIYKKISSKRSVHERIVRREIALGIKPDFDPSDPLDRLLPSSMKDHLAVKVLQHFQGLPHSTQTFH